MKHLTYRSVLINSRPSCNKYYRKSDHCLACSTHYPATSKRNNEHVQCDCVVLCDSAFPRITARGLSGKSVKHQGLLPIKLRL